MGIPLKIGAQTAVPPTGYKEIILDADGDPKLLSADGTRADIGGGGSGTVDVAAPISGDGSGGDPVTIADGAIAVAKLGAMAAAGFLGAAAAGAVAQKTVAESLAIILPNFNRFKIATILTDADITVAPQTDKTGIYVLPAATLSANRVFTITNGGGTNTQTFAVLRIDQGAFTYTMRTSAPATLYTSAASPGAIVLYSFYYTAGAWVANTFQYQQIT